MLLVAAVVFLPACGSASSGSQPTHAKSASPPSTALTAEEQQYISHAFAVGTSEMRAIKVLNEPWKYSMKRLQATLFKMVKLDTEWSSVESPSDRVALVGQFTAQATANLSQGAEDFAKAVETKNPKYGHAFTRERASAIRLLNKAAAEAVRLAKMYGIQKP
jgi:hypothetical protein